MRREIAGSVKLSLLLWHLASTLTRPAAGLCLPNITRIDDPETDHAHTEQHEAPQPDSVHKRVSFQMQGMACGRDATCCSRTVFVAQGAIIRLTTICMYWQMAHRLIPPPLSIRHQQIFFSLNSRSTQFQWIHASFAGQYDGFAAQGLDSGLERSKNGRNLGFLANMEWRPKHVVLVSCHAVAGLQILSRQKDECHLGFTSQALQGVHDRYEESSGGYAGALVQYMWQADMCELPIWRTMLRSICKCSPLLGSDI